MALPMTDNEIYRSWLNAENQIKQVTILSELNACPKDIICEILKEQGADYRKLPRKRKPRENPKESVSPAKKNNGICTTAEDNTVVNESLPVISDTATKTIEYIASLRKEKEQLNKRLTVINAELLAIMGACKGDIE